MVKIAIVDDNYLLRQNIVQRLKPYRDIMVVHVSANGLQFLEALAASAPDNLPEVVLMDIQMDVLDGIETTRRAKQAFPQMQFIMLTIADDEEHIFQAVQAGASGYLLKEETASVIVKAIRGIKAGEAYMSPVIAKKTLNLLRSNTSPEKTAPVHAQPPASPPPPEKLSRREAEILELLTAGYTYQLISEKLYISTYTVQTHIKNIYHKLRVKNKLGAVKIALDHKWFKK